MPLHSVNDIILIFTNVLLHPVLHWNIMTEMVIYKTDVLYLFLHGMMHTYTEKYSVLRDYLYIT